MDSELLRQLVSNPLHWPFYLILAAIVVFVLKIINVAADAAVRHLSEQAKRKKGLLLWGKTASQVIAIALVIYLANAIYWSRTTRQLVPSPLKKTINAFEATVELVIESNDGTSTYLMNVGGYLVFALSDKLTLTLTAPDSHGQPFGADRYLWRSLFKMDAMDPVAGRPVEMLRETKSIKVEFLCLPKEYSVTGGKVVCVINGEVRFDIPIPPQSSMDGKVYVRDMETLKQTLK